MRATKRALLAATALAVAGFAAPAAHAQNPFTGFFVGVNGGYGFNDITGDNSKTRNYSVPLGGLNNVDPSVAGTAGNLAITGSKGSDGFVGGGQAGYNYQYGYFVYGFESDIQYVGFGSAKSGSALYTVTDSPNYKPPTVGAGGKSVSSGYAPVGSTSTLQFANTRFTDAGLGSLDYYGTARGKVGYAFDYTTMLYLTGGLAYGGGTGRTVNGGSNSINIGYAVGGGLEYLITKNVSARVEGMYVSIQQDGTDSLCCVYSNNNAAVSVPVSNGKSRSQDFVVARAGLNYKFDYGY